MELNAPISFISEENLEFKIGTKQINKTAQIDINNHNWVQRFSICDYGLKASIGNSPSKLELYLKMNLVFPNKLKIKSGYSINYYPKYGRILHGSYYTGLEWLYSKDYLITFSSYRAKYDCEVSIQKKITDNLTTYFSTKPSCAYNSFIKDDVSQNGVKLGYQFWINDKKINFMQQLSLNTALVSKVSFNLNPKSKIGLTMVSYACDEFGREGKENNYELGMNIVYGD